MALVGQNRFGFTLPFHQDNRTLDLTDPSCLGGRHRHHFRISRQMSAAKAVHQHAIILFIGPLPRAMGCDCAADSFYPGAAPDCLVSVVITNDRHNHHQQVCGDSSSEQPPRALAKARPRSSTDIKVHNTASLGAAMAMYLLAFCFTIMLH
jgi:hypothetical protein